MNITIEFNDLFEKALGLLENTHKNVFVTGKAGTGKSTLLNYFRLDTRKKVVVLAPTGVAAINVSGETIHSFFGFKPDITLEKVRRLKFKRGKPNIYKKLDAIIIDEISMVRSDLLDCMDKFLRLNGPNSKKPFGGLQMIFFGDLYQLPPVVVGREKAIFKDHYETEYFFSAKVFKKLAMEYLELEKVYRQKDEKFIALLNSIRNNTAGDEELGAINQRLDATYDPKGDFYIHLTTTNSMASEINSIELAKLPGQLAVYQGMLDGDFEVRQLPTEMDLKIKPGAQVMMLNNDPMGHWVNGTMAKIIKAKEDEIVVELANGNQYQVAPYTWEIFHFQLDPTTGGLSSEIVASYTQFPLKLAWAITIHKSQGKTFDNVIIDIGKGTFAHGQMYVALSRCRSLEGMVLKKPIKKSHIFMDWRIVKFVTGYQYLISEKELSFKDKKTMIEKAIEDRKWLKITYLKATDEKSKRVIEPISCGEMNYNGKPFFGVRALCQNRGQERTFRLDRMLEIEEV